MTDDLEGFDPGAAASGAGAAVEAAADADDQPDRGDDVDEDRKESSGSDSSSGGVLETFILPAFLAEERGPTAATFQKHDVDGGLSLILDGFTDYVLELVGKDVGDNLGPAGKIGLGFSRLKGDDSSSSSKDRKESSGSDSSSDDAGDDGVEDPFDRSGAAAV